MYKDFLLKNYDIIQQIINGISVGIYITDGHGVTLMLNDESCKTGGLPREQVLGRSMMELEAVGFVENSVTLRVLDSKEEESLIQNLGDGDQVYVTGKPIFESDEVDLVISTERDITETLTLRKLLEEKDAAAEQIQEEVEYLRKQNIVMWGNLIAMDDSSKRVAEQAMRIAGLDTTVLLTGESGTGKEVFANFIYQNSNRVGKPFIKVNSAAIPENLMESELFGYDAGSFTGANKEGKRGIFEMANHGTLFLDEIGDIPLHLQSKLLRVLQEKEVMRIGSGSAIPVDVRLIAATNRDLKTAIYTGSFRGDLYYRLNIMPLELPPLRERKKDIVALTEYFIENFNKEYKLNKSIATDAMEALQAFDWPGNIRELENVMERIMISFDGDIITKFQVERAIGVQLPSAGEAGDIREEKGMDRLMLDYEKEILTRMMAKYKRASEVGRVLNINKSTLSRKLKRHGIK